MAVGVGDARPSSFGVTLGPCHVVWGLLSPCCVLTFVLVCGQGLPCQRAGPLPSGPNLPFAIAHGPGSATRAWRGPPTGLLSWLPDPSLPPMCKESSVSSVALALCPAHPPQHSDEPGQSLEPCPEGPARGGKSRGSEKNPCNELGPSPAHQLFSALPLPGPQHVTGSWSPCRVASTRCTYVLYLCPCLYIVYESYLSPMLYISVPRLDVCVLSRCHK